jgi:nicotinamide riboside transporter PnuC
VQSPIFLRSLLVGEPILRIFRSQLSILPVVFRWKEDLAFGSQLVTEGWEKVKGSGWVKVFQARVLLFLARASRITE